MNTEHYNKISAYCTSTERCKSEVMEKMRKLEVPEGEWDEIVKRLQTEGFIDERRYAEAFTKDKFRFAKWGKRKIEYALRAKGISEVNIQAASGCIDEEEYESVKKQLAESKAKTLKGDKNSMENRAKILRFLAGRGFMVALLLTIAAPHIMAQGRITGVARSYVCRTLELMYEDNGITGTMVRVDSCTVDSTGAFTLSTDVTETRKCIIPLGAYNGVIYVEPYKTYSVNLPPLTLPSEADLLNPYFKPKEILLSLNNPAEDDLNLRITAFDDSFDVAFKHLIDSAITPERIEREYTELEYNFGDSNPFFTTYRYCCYAILVNLYEPTQPNTAIDAFFIDAPIAYNNPAYWDAFNVLFDDYKDLDALKPNPALRELVIMHHVLAGNLSGAWLTSVKDERNIAIAAQVKALTTAASAGTHTATTNVTTIDGERLSLKDFETTQFYIIFANSKLSKSLSDLDYALKSNTKWKGRCVALVIFTDDTKDGVEALTKGLKGRKYVLWSGDNSELVKAFNVKNAPAYFRIDASGKILESPAAEPARFSIYD